jgi:hypothetical protein
MLDGSTMMMSNNFGNGNNNNQNNNNQSNNNQSNNNQSNNNQSNNNGTCLGNASSKFLRSLILVSILSGILVLTYDKCIVCVIVVAIISGLTMTCVPLMPLVFMVSTAVLLLHAIDYNSATIRVEVPLQNVIYIPTWKDVEEYVHVSPNAGGTDVKPT